MFHDAVALSLHRLTFSLLRLGKRHFRRSSSGEFFQIKEWGSDG
jgi:hypothetical protein